jgi:peptidoglycan/xylan/chitin deacetylase (PgdA/CDA1 family)
MLTQSAGKKVPILLYHSISQHITTKYKQFVVSPALFAEHMAYLHQHAYTPITVSQFVHARDQEGLALPERPVVLTFDDGFADFFTEALPILQRYGFVATLYVPTAFIGTNRWLKHDGEATRPMLTWDQLTKISECGIECGAHSHSHPQLDILPRDAAHEEIVQCKRLLEQHLGGGVSSFAYPFGFYSATVRRLIQEAGYTSACAVKEAMSSETTDPFALARLSVIADTSVDALAALLTGYSSSAITKIYTHPLTLVRQLALLGLSSQAVRICSARIRGTYPTKSLFRNRSEAALIQGRNRVSE